MDRCFTQQSITVKQRSITVKQRSITMYDTRICRKLGMTCSQAQRDLHGFLLCFVEQNFSSGSHVDEEIAYKNCHMAVHGHLGYPRVTVACQSDSALFEESPVRLAGDCNCPRCPLTKMCIAPFVCRV
jgi:hypothetical protein